MSCMFNYHIITICNETVRNNFVWLSYVSFYRTPEFIEYR